MSTHRKQKTSILLVEDFEDARFVLKQLLELRGYHVVEAIDGQQAVEVALHERPSLILMDLSLPVLDGLSATRQIREHAELRDVPIVAISTFHTKQHRADVLAAGCDKYLSKPIDIDKLETLIIDLLRSRPNKPMQ